MRPYLFENANTGKLEVNRKWGDVYTYYKQDPTSPIYLNLKWKSRSAIAAHRAIFFDAQLKYIEIKKLGELSPVEIAADGFHSKEECYKTFAKMYNVDMKDIEQFKVYIIQWKPGSCENCLHKKICFNQFVPVDYFITYLYDGFEIPHYSKRSNQLCPQFCYRKNGPTKPNFIKIIDLKTAKPIEEKKSS
jgi:hypothetical protein